MGREEHTISIGENRARSLCINTHSFILTTKRGGQGGNERALEITEDALVPDSASVESVLDSARGTNLARVITALARALWLKDYADVASGMVYSLLQSSAAMKLECTYTLHSPANI